MCRAFGDEHEQLYGHRSDPHNPLEVIAVRIVGRAGALDSTLLIEPALPTGGIPTDRQAYFGKRWGLVNTPVITRSDLQQARQGPLLIDEYDTTIVVPPTMKACTDTSGNVMIEATDG